MKNTYITKKGNYPEVIKYNKHKSRKRKKCIVIIKIFMETNNSSLLWRGLVLKIWIIIVS